MSALAGADSSGMTWGADFGDLTAAADQVQAQHEALAAQYSGVDASKIADLRAGNIPVGTVKNPEQGFFLEKVEQAKSASPVTNVLPGIKDSSEIPGVIQQGGNGWLILAVFGVIGFYFFKKGGF